MIKLDRLYSEPEIFTPISFRYGLNIIMGEKSESSNKKIGVGKSISIEFLNFCLLKNFSASRLSLMPKSLIDSEVRIYLDIIFNSYKLTIVRQLGKNAKIIIFKDGEELPFDNTDDASDYLGNLYFEDYPADIARISFRNLLAPIIRDERSEFKDIIKCFDTNRQIPRDYKPHLFFLGLNISLYNEITQTISELDKKGTYLSETKRLITNDGEISINDAKAHLNELDSEVSKINASIEQLKNAESFEVIQSDLIKMESELEELRINQKAFQFEAKQISSFPQPEHINDIEIAILFNQFKSGLGNMISKSIEDVKKFKNQIDSFRKTIVNKRLENIKSELSIINERIRKLDDEYSSKISLLDNGSVLKDLKTSVRIFESKNSELHNLDALIQRYDTTERQKKLLLALKIALISDFDEQLFKFEAVLLSFKNTILWIHEQVMGNREAHFEIRTNNNKEFIDFILRTDDDGSHTTERMKVFIYDNALMFNEYTKQNHPGFLVHDNIFDKDDDSLERSLIFINNQDKAHPDTFQYILTLNRDLIASVIEKGRLDFDIEENKIASLTKDSRFLKTIDKYTETRKK